MPESPAGFAFGYSQGRFSYFRPAARDVLWDNRRCSGGSRALFAAPGMQRFALPGAGEAVRTPQ
jgi:hypothetical protein